MLVVLFLVLLIASLVVARRSCIIEPAQRTYEHVARCFMRVMIGCMWFQGSLWKLPLPVSGGLKFWTEEEGRYAAFEARKWFATHVMVPGLPVLNSVVFLTEFSLALSFMLGLFVRPMAIVGFAGQELFASVDRAVITFVVPPVDLYQVSRISGRFMANSTSGIRQSGNGTCMPEGAKPKF